LARSRVTLNGGGAIPRFHPSSEKELDDMASAELSKIADLLARALENAPEDDTQALGAALRQYAHKFPRTYKRMAEQPAMGTLLEAIEYGCGVIYDGEDVTG